MDRPFKGPSQPEDFYIVPKELIEDLSILSSTIRLYAIIKKRTIGEHDIPTSELCKSTGLTRSRVKAHKAMLGKRGFLQRAFDHYGNPYWSAVFNLETVRRDTDLFLSVSIVFNRICNSKAFLLLKAKHDPERFLVAMEKVEWDYQDKTVNNPIGLLKFYLDKVEKAKNGFQRGFWKVRLKQKEAHKEADRIAKKTSAVLEREQRERESFEKGLASLAKKQHEAFESEAKELLRANGGIPKYGPDKAIKNKMFDMWKDRGGFICQT